MNRGFRQVLDIERNGNAVNLDAITGQLYALVTRLPRFGFPVPRDKIPHSGLYLFFEHGEQITNNELSYERVTRVGTHIANGRLYGRLRQHFGTVTKLRGNKNASVFRRHLGGALLRRENQNDHRLEEWLKSHGQRPPEVEARVSEYLRENCTFCCIPVETKEHRKELESGLVALLAQHPMSPPSPDWLGSFAKSIAIRETGLWNVNETESVPLTQDRVDHLEKLVAESVMES